MSNFLKKKEISSVNPHKEMVNEIVNSLCNKALQ